MTAVDSEALRFDAPRATATAVGADGARGRVQRLACSTFAGMEEAWGAGSAAATVPEATAGVILISC